VFAILFRKRAKAKTGRVFFVIADDTPLMIGTLASHDGSLHCGEVTQLFVTLAIKVHF